MAIGAYQQLIPGGITPTYATPASSDTIAVSPGDDRVFLHVKNANASACVVTFTDSGKTPAGSSATNPTVSVPANTGDKMIPVHPSLSDPATGLVTVGFSVTSSVTVAAIRR
jgi:hypothetical protein